MILWVQQFINLIAIRVFWFLRNSGFRGAISYWRLWIRLKPFWIADQLLIYKSLVIPLIKKKKKKIVGYIRSFLLWIRKEDQTFLLQNLMSRSRSSNLMYNLIRKICSGEILLKKICKEMLAFFLAPSSKIYCKRQLFLV